jgi:PAS domain S-box-containing protein
MNTTHPGEPFFEGLVEALSDAVLVVEKGHPHYVYVNAATEALLGYTRAELLALGPADVSTPESIATLGELAEVLERGGVWRGRWHLRRKDGTTVQIAGTATRRVVMGRTLYQGLARATAGHASTPRIVPDDGRLLDATGQAVIAADMDGTLTYWNRAAEAFYGRPAEQALGRQILDLIPPGASREESARMAARLQAGETVAGETLVERPDGTRFRALITASPIRDEDGRQVGILGVAVRADVATSPTPSVEQGPGMRQRRALIRCAACGREVPGTARRRYCSEKCRQWAYYHRNVQAQHARSRARHRRRTDASEGGNEPSSAEDDSNVEGGASAGSAAADGPGAAASAEGDARG